MRYIDNNKEIIKNTLESSFNNSIGDLYFGLGLVKNLEYYAAELFDDTQYKDVCDQLSASADSLEYAYRNLGACMDLVDKLDTYVETDDEGGEDNGF